MSDLTLSPEELFALTGYELATKQLNVLRAAGFTRARIGRKGVVLERSHYEAVTRGENAPTRKTINLAHLRAV